MAYAGIVKRFLLTQCSTMRHLPKSGHSSVCFLQHQDMSRIECAEKHNNTYVCSRLCVNSWCIKENYRETLGRYGGSVSLLSSTYFSQLPITKSCCLLVLIGQWMLFTDTLWDINSWNVLIVWSFRCKGILYWVLHYVFSVWWWIITHYKPRHSFKQRKAFLPMPHYPWWQRTWMPILIWCIFCY